MAFDHLRVTQNYTGYVIFLEEDHYVAPDFLAVAKQLIQMKSEKCLDCDFINMGMYNKAKLTNRVSRRGGEERVYQVSSVYASIAQCVCIKLCVFR